MSVMAMVRHDQLTVAGSPMLPSGRASVIANQGSNFQTLGAVGFGVGAAAVAVAAGMFVLGKPSAPVQVQFGVGADGAMVGVGGSFR